MPYFSTEQLTFTHPFELDPKEKEKLFLFLSFLDESSVGAVIDKYSRVNRFSGGRPPYNPFRLFSTLIYAYSKPNMSLRKIEELTKFDLRFICLMENDSPSHVAISRFLNNIVVKGRKEIFSCIVNTLLKKYEISAEDSFIDGTKIEANANKYKFVWKPSKHRINLVNNILEVLKKYVKVPDKKKNITSKELGKNMNIIYDRIINELGKITPKGKGHRYKEIEKDYYLLSKYQLKLLEYEEIEEICGKNRNSYYKTDHDATAMCLKEDYYSGVGSNMHAGYNIQISVSKGIITDFYVSQDRNDQYTLIPFLKDYYSLYGCYPKRVCADAGYGSYKNYKFLDENNIENYVKYNLWNKEVDGKYIDKFRVDDKDDVICLNGKKGKLFYGSNTHPTSKNELIYIIDECLYCRFKKVCNKGLANQYSDKRMFRINKEYIKYKAIARKNLLSIKGIEMRVNRSSQVEGAFGVMKQDMGFERFNYRGLEKVEAEVMLVCLGYNIRKLMRLIDGTAKLDYWIPPENIEEEKMPEPNFKKLAKDNKTYIGINAELRKNRKKKGC